MKKRVSKDLVLFIILIPIFLWGAFYISSRMENRLPPYSALNKARTGCSVYFEALKELDYPVERTVKPIGEVSVDNIQIAAQNGSFDLNNESIKKWVGDGGVLVYLAPLLDLTEMEYGGSPETKGSVTIYKYEKGYVVSADVAMFTNKALMGNREAAYQLLEEIDRHPHKKIFFNESHLFAMIYRKTLWDYIPLEIKFLIYQLLIILAAFFYFKGKRFGKPIPLYEEVERTENEYLYSAASLYRQAKCWDLMLENYYKDFLKQAGCSHDNWLEYWEREKLPSDGRARRVYDFMHDKNSKPKVKEYINIVTTIEQLKGILKKRRDSYWKTWKKPL